jgi:hypothetical protein
MTRRRSDADTSGGHLRVASAIVMCHGATRSISGSGDVPPSRRAVDRAKKNTRHVTYLWYIGLFAAFPVYRIGYLIARVHTSAAGCRPHACEVRVRRQDVDPRQEPQHAPVGKQLIAAVHFDDAAPPDDNDDCDVPRACGRYPEAAGDVVHCPVE